MDDVLRINMFGEFSISYGDKTITDRMNRSKKTWTLLQYLIAHRDRDISKNELIDLLWPESEIDDPSNTLKTLLHRLRTTIETLNIDKTNQIIVSSGGTYSLNKSINYIVDTDVFEHLLQEAYSGKLSLKDKLAKLCEAVEFYKGDFLARNSLETWIVPISTYFRAKYMKAATDIVEIFMRQEKYSELVEFCQKVVTIDPFEERIHFALVKGLIETGKNKQAINHYNYVSELFYQNFSAALSPEFVQLYNDISGTIKTVERDIIVVKRKLQEENLTDGCYYCDYDVFKSIYQLEARSADRIGQTVHLCLLTITNTKGQMPTKRALAKGMESLRDIIQKSLRMGDIFTRYSVCQYLLMLPLTTYENARIVVERLSKSYRRDNPSLNAVLHISLQAVEPPKLAKIN